MEMVGATGIDRNPDGALLSFVLAPLQNRTIPIYVNVTYIIANSRTILR